MIRNAPDIGMAKVILVSLPEGWSKKSEARWNMTNNPESWAMIWVNEKGEVKFKPPEQDEIMTFEERKLQPRNGQEIQEESLHRINTGIDEGDLKLGVPVEDERIDENVDVEPHVEIQQGLGD